MLIRHRDSVEGSCSRPKDSHMTTFLAETAVASICNIHDLLLFHFGQNRSLLGRQGKLNFDYIYTLLTNLYLLKSNYIVYVYLG